jgi:hypothetical protein
MRIMSFKLCDGRSKQAATFYRQYRYSVLNKNPAHFRASMPFLTQQDIRNQWQVWADQFSLFLSGRPSAAAGKNLSFKFVEAFALSKLNFKLC